MLYDFMAQGDDEVTVAAGDEVVILDDTKSDEWWMVRRIKNGKEGVVPSSYVEITGVNVTPEPSFSGVKAGLSTVEQNRLEEVRLTKESARKSKGHDSNDARVGEVGPGMKLPERGSSLVAREDGNEGSQRHKRDSKLDGKSSKPSTRFLMYKNRLVDYTETDWIRQNLIPLRRESGPIDLEVSRL